MDLNWLADFVALTESRSFSRAAARRHITQPAFSRRIRALEQWTGALLFERGPRAVTLTEAGRRLLPWAETLRRQVDEARTDARAALPAPVEPLRIAATHSLSLTFFSEWMMAIGGPLSLGPVQLASESLAGCERLMGEGQAQFVLAHSHPATPVRLDPASFSSVLVGADALVPVAAPGIAAAIDRSGGDSSGHPFITYSEDFEFRPRSCPPSHDVADDDRPQAGLHFPSRRCSESHGPGRPRRGLVAALAYPGRTRSPPPRASRRRRREGRSRSKFVCSDRRPSCVVSRSPFGSLRLPISTGALDRRGWLRIDPPGVIPRQGIRIVILSRD